MCWYLYDLFMKQNSFIFFQVHSFIFEKIAYNLSECHPSIFHSGPSEKIIIPSKLPACLIFNKVFCECSQVSWLIEEKLCIKSKHVDKHEILNWYENRWGLEKGSGSRFICCCSPYTRIALQLGSRNSIYLPFFTFNSKILLHFWYSFLSKIYSSIQYIGPIHIFNLKNFSFTKG